MNPRINAIAVSVVRALWLSGGLNAGTPLEIASVPVNAAQPEENARNISQSVRPCVATTVSWGGASCRSEPGVSPSMTFARPVRIIAPIIRRKKYVGAANIVPDSRTPLRLPERNQRDDSDAYRRLEVVEFGYCRRYRRDAGCHAH